MTATALVPVFTGTIADRAIQLCDARTLHSFMQVKRDFTTWIKGRIRKFGFVANEDYLLTKSGERVFTKSGENLGLELDSPNRGNQVRGHGGDRKSTDYHLTLDMAKELAMVENNEQGRAARRYFIECERKALEAAQTARPYSPADNDPALQAMIDQWKAIVNSDDIPAPAAPMPAAPLADAARTQAAFEAAAQAGAAVQAQVFKALLQGHNTLERLRFLLTIDLKELHPLPALLQAIAQEARLIDLRTFAHDIEHGECLIPTTDLLTLANACTRRAHKRVQNEVNVAKARAKASAQQQLGMH